MAGPQPSADPCNTVLLLGNTVTSVLVQLERQNDCPKVQVEPPTLSQSPPSIGQVHATRSRVAEVAHLPANRLCVAPSCNCHGFRREEAKALARHDATTRSDESLDAELYRILVENSADMIVRGDAVGRRIYVSPSYQEVLGYAPDEVLGGDRLSIVHPDEAEAVAAALRTLGPLTPPVTSVFRIRRKDGVYIWIEGRYRHLADGGILAVLRDITDRKRIEAQLAEANGGLRSTNLILEATLEHIRQGVCFFDGVQRLIICNRRYAHIYDLTPDDTRPGQLLEDIVRRRIEVGSSPEMTVESYVGWRDELRQSGKQFDSEVKLRNGKTILITHRPMPDDGWVATHEDITERRRTEELLHQAGKLEAIGRITAGVAHDFNNLLQTVGTALEMVGSMDEVSADLALMELIEDATRAVAGGGRLTQQLLTSSRKQMLRPKPVDLGVAIREMSPLLRQAAGDGVRFGLHTEGGPFPGSVDVEQLRAALLDLVINARDAMAEGGRFDIALAHLAGTGGKLVESRCVTREPASPPNTCPR
jgi:PAS domain S-box-containing protein